MTTAEEPLIELIDEEGLAWQFQVHDAIDVDEVTYLLVEAVDDPDQVMLLRRTGETLEPVTGPELAGLLELLDDDSEDDDVDTDPEQQ
ncbi:MAG TPA: hypothetical protein VG015_03965 [Candidatus Dormibacteraeota bacterium]|jgi:hypothetical protein|nr:hypothetical protein [Candidatus Dormibacteraeota bacterium]